LIYQFFTLHFDFRAAKSTSNKQTKASRFHHLPIILAITMTRDSCDSPTSSNLPVRSLISCRVDSGAISSLTIPAELLDHDSCPVMPGRMASLPRGMMSSDRFKQGAPVEKDKVPKRPTGRRVSIQRPQRSQPSVGELRKSAPPRCPKRQSTASKSSFIVIDTTDDRPGLSRQSVGGKGGLSSGIYDDNEGDIKGDIINC